MIRDIGVAIAAVVSVAVRIAVEHKAPFLGIGAVEDSREEKQNSPLTKYESRCGLL